MLQQTTAVAVVPYFERWIARFPDLRSLASAREEDVLGLWQGLGYYNRARNLLRAAREVVSKYGGQFPNDPHLLQTLPGFGAYTAGAVAAFAFDQPEIVIDANIQRVLVRLADIREPVDAAAGRERVRAAARGLLPRQRGGRIHTGALMELGALICRPRDPLCGVCPVREFCQTSTPEVLPVKRPRPAPSERHDRRSVILQGRRVALIPSPGPHWRGLWLLPAAGPDDETLFSMKYAVTRYRVTLEVARGLRIPQGIKLFHLRSLPPMPSPHARALDRALASSSIAFDEQSVVSFSCQSCVHNACQ